MSNVVDTVTVTELSRFGPYFDQEEPERSILGMIAEFDRSQPYELDAGAIFRCVDGGLLVVLVGGCSCWPDMGSTTQHYFKTREEAIAFLEEGGDPEPEMKAMILGANRAGWEPYVVLKQD